MFCQPIAALSPLNPLTLEGKKGKIIPSVPTIQEKNRERENKL